MRSGIDLKRKLPEPFLFVKTTLNQWNTLIDRKIKASDYGLYFKALLRAAGEMSVELASLQNITPK